MREIKFRVFDKDLKKMHICGENIHDSMSFINGQACYYNLQNGCGSLPAGFDGERTYELMQYTGLKDKNGKEIYEGDIVYQKFHDERPLDVGGFIGVVKQLEGGWVIDNGVNHAEYLWSELNENQVIGNIYENPELINEGDTEIEN